MVKGGIKNIMKYLVKFIGLLIIAGVIIGFPIAATLSYVYDWALYIKIIATCLAVSSLFFVMHQINRIIS